MDLNKNTSLEFFSCNNNKLTKLDLSKNSKLRTLDCSSNLLNELNLKNGNNSNFASNIGTVDGTYAFNIQLNFKNNNDLKCIEVDNISYSDTNWASRKDAFATYNTSCPTLGLNENYYNQIALYPNPTKGEVNIENIALEKATVYNVLGQLVKSFTLNSGSQNNTISLYGLPKGVYFMYLINKDSASVKKVIVE